MCENQTFATSCVCLVTQLCPTLCNPMDCMQPTRFLCPWGFPGKNTGVGCHFLLQESSWLRNQTSISYVSCTTSRFFTCWAIMEALVTLSHWNLEIIYKCHVTWSIWTDTSRKSKALFYRHRGEPVLYQCGLINPGEVTWLGEVTSGGVGWVQGRGRKSSSQEGSMKTVWQQALKDLGLTVRNRYCAGSWK